MGKVASKSQVHLHKITLKGITEKSACMFSGQSGQQMSEALKIKATFVLSGHSGQQMSEALKIKPAFMLSGQCGRQISAAFQ